MLHVSVSVQAPVRTDETNVVSPETKGTVLFRDIKNITYYEVVMEMTQLKLKM